MGSGRLNPLPPRWMPAVIIAVTLLVLGAGWAVYSGASDTAAQNSVLQQDKVIAETERDATAKQASTLADQVQAACAAGGETATELGRIGACAQAAQVQADPVVVRGERGPGPTAAQVEQAVADWLAAHPLPAGRAPTAAEVATAVAEWMTAHPPEPGRAPTAAEIAAAVAIWFEANPPRDGQPGRPPTDEEIAAAVDEWLQAHPPAQGAQGIGVSAVRAEQTAGGCMLVFTLTDPSSGATTEQSVPVSLAVCAAAPIDPTPTPGANGDTQ